MKWVFFLALVLLAPTLTFLLRAKPRYLPHTCFVMGVSMFLFVPSAWAAPVGWPGWQGTVKGIEVSLIDPVSIALLLSTNPVRIPWSIKAPFALLCFALVVSTLAASQWMPSTFYIWQLFRSALLFVAVARVCRAVPGAPVALLAGLGAGLVYEAGFAVYQYGIGVPRPGGNLGHSNFLGLATDFVVLPAFALMLGTRRFLWPGIIVLAAVAIAVVGGSRATLGLTAAGLLLTLIFSLQHGRTSRKFAFGGAAALLLLVSVPVIAWSAHRRSTEELASSDAERDAMKLAAKMIIADHPFGVGANQYVIVTNTGGYSQRAGVSWNENNRAAPVHDTYYLIAAELGLIGLIAFLATIASFIWLGFRSLRRKSDDESNELVPGLLATMIVVSVHISYEWVFMHFFLHYMFAVAAGLLLGITAQTRSPAKARPSVRPALAAARAG